VQRDRSNTFRIELRLAVAAVVLVPVFLWLVPWGKTEYSGWADLAQVHPAGDRPLLNSLGTATVALDEPGKLRFEFSYSNFSGGTRDIVYIEVGYDDAGFWMRSQRFDPQPPIFIPWTSVAACESWRYQLKDSAIRIIIHDDPLLRQCSARIAGR